MLQTGQSRASSKLLPFPTAANDIHQPAHGEEGAQKPHVPLLKVLVDGQQLGALIGLNVVPRSRVLLRPDD